MPPLHSRLVRPAVVVSLAAALVLTLPLHAQEAGTLSDDDTASLSSPPTERKSNVELDPSFRIPQGKSGDSPNGDDHDGISHTPAVIFTPDGKWMLTATSNGEVVVFERATREIVRHVKARGELAGGVSISRDGKLAAWGLAMGGVVVLDLETGEPVASLAGADGDEGNGETGEEDTGEEDTARTNSPTWPAIAPDGKTLALARGKAVELRDLRTLELLRTFGGHRSAITNLAWSPDGALLASTSADGRLLVHDVPSATRQAEIKKAEALHAVAFAPGGSLISFGGVDKNVYLYDLAAQKEEVLSEPGSQPYWITCLGFSPDGAKLAAGDESCDIWLFDLASKTRIFHNKHHVECWLGGVAWAPDNETFLFACRPNTHAGKPAIWQALSIAEAARCEEVRESRRKLLAECDRLLADADDETVKEAIQKFRQQLTEEESVKAPGLVFAGGWPSDVQYAQNAVPFPLAENLIVQADDAAAGGGASQDPGSPSEGDAGTPTPGPQQQAALPQQAIQNLRRTAADHLAGLPDDLRKQADAHQQLVAQKATALNTSYFCVNQWRVGKDAGGTQAEAQQESDAAPTNP